MMQGAASDGPAPALCSRGSDAAAQRLMCAALILRVQTMKKSPWKK